jgi:hypothetical protein
MFFVRLFFGKDMLAAQCCSAALDLLLAYVSFWDLNDMRFECSTSHMQIPANELLQ